MGKRGRKPLTRQERIDRLIQVGYSSTDAKKYANKKEYSKARRRATRKSEVIQKRKKQYKGRNVVVMLKEKTDAKEDFRNYIETFTGQKTEMTPTRLENSIANLMSVETGYGMIGVASVGCVDDVESYLEVKSFEGFYLVYVGTGNSWTQVQQAMITCLTCLYEQYEKYDFAFAMRDNFYKLGTPRGNFIAKQIHEKFIK